MGRITAAILALMLAGVGCTTRDGPTETEAALSSATASIPSTSSVPNLSPAELLVSTDLPAVSEQWVTQKPVPPYFWDADLTSGISLHICEDQWKAVAGPPLDKLQARAATALSSGQVNVFEVVYTDAADTVDDAFDIVTQKLTDCLNDSDKWSDAFSPQAVEQDGWYMVADRLLMPSLGDKRFAMQYTALTDDGGRLDHRMAVIRRGGRLIVVELSESWTNEILTDDDFTDIVRRAVERVRSAATTSD